jgi:hypothetical protein
LASSPSTKQGLQEKEASGVIVNYEHTHSNGKLISGVVHYRLNNHFMKIGARGGGGCDFVKKNRRRATALAKPAPHPTSHGLVKIQPVPVKKKTPKTAFLGSVRVGVGSWVFAHH